MNKFIFWIIMSLLALLPQKEITKVEFIDITTVEAVAIFEEKQDAILFFSGDTCPWCQAAEPVLVEAAKEAGISKIYRCDPRDERDDLKEGTKGSDEYYQLLEILHDYLRDYDNYDEKRIYIPDVYAVVDGEVLKNHIGTLDSHKSYKDELTTVQKIELKEIYLDIFAKFLERG